MAAKGESRNILHVASMYHFVSAVLSGAAADTEALCAKRHSKAAGGIG